jgi:hypothetical protein
VVEKIKIQKDRIKNWEITINEKLKTLLPQGLG